MAIGYSIFFSSVLHIIQWLFLCWSYSEFWKCFDNTKLFDKPIQKKVYSNKEIFWFNSEISFRWFPQNETRLPQLENRSQTTDPS